MSDSSRCYTIMQIAIAQSVEKTTVLRRSKREAWPFAVRLTRGGREKSFALASLPADVQAAIFVVESKNAGGGLANGVAAGAAGKQAAVATPPSRDSSQAWALYDRKPASIKAEAEKRLNALVTIERVMESGTRKIAAIEAAAPSLQIPVPTLRRWFKLVKNVPRSDWLPALAPRWQGRTALVAIAPEVFDFWKALWLTRSQTPAATCYEKLQREAKKQGWSVPALATLLRRTERELPAPAIVLARKGEAAAAKMFPAQQRDRTGMHAMQCVVADGRRHDLFVKWPDGTVARPHLVAWQDVYSGLILAWRVDISENKELVRLSFGDLVDRWGIPEIAYLDNGRAFASKWLTGGQKTRYRFKIRDEDPLGCLTAMGTTVRWATPGHGQAKPIERGFGDLANNIDKHPVFEGCWIGNKPEMRPEEYDGRAVPLADFLDVAGREIAAHNAREGRRSPTCAGRSFQATFEESYRANPPRRATEGQRALWLLAAEGVTARAPDGALYLGGNRYWCEALARYIGEKLVVRFDPQKLQAPALVYALDGRFITAADCVEAAGFLSIDAAQAQARDLRTFKKANREALAAERRMSTREAGKRLLEHDAPAEAAAPETKVSRPVFGKPALPTTPARAERAAAIAARQLDEDEAFEAGLTKLEDFRRRSGAA